MKSMSIVRRMMRRKLGTRLMGSYPPKSTNKTNPRILVTGAAGQIGYELVGELRRRYGKENVVAADIKRGQFESVVFCDVLMRESMEQIIVEERIDWLVHLAAILSADGESNPERLMLVNNRGAENALALAARHKLRLFVPSSIAAFGRETPKTKTPDLCIQDPTTVYGVGKVYIELLGKYFHTVHGLDFRSLRYPGIVSYKTAPGGGSTGYAVAMFHAALKKETYECPIAPDTMLPMMYVDDCIRGTVDLIAADETEALRTRVYNIAGLSFTPKMLADAINKYQPLDVVYKPDKRNEIALSWPDSLDDSSAKKEWDWEPEYGLDLMVRTMFDNLAEKPGPSHE